MRLNVKNISGAMQGVHCVNGMKYLEPGETKALDVADGYVDRLRSLGKYFEVSGGAPMKEAQKASETVTGPATIKHKGGGKFAVLINGELQPGDLMPKDQALATAEALNKAAAELEK